jgi:hypothetical protein
LCGETVNIKKIKDQYIMTNHFQHVKKQLRTINDPFITKWTASRLAQGNALIQDVSTLDDIKLLLSDHKHNPDYSICNHGKINAASSYIIDCTGKIIYCCQGNPCKNNYIAYSI